MSRVRVWDPFVRFFHWGTAAAFFINFWWIEDGPLHRWIGYGVGILLAARLVWGVFGSPHARFSDFAPTPTRLRNYLSALRRGEHAVYAGHNPVGGLMILALLSGLAVICATGIMLRMDLFWGVDWVEEAHEIAAEAVHALVAIHVMAVLLSDRIFGEGLLPAMIHGDKELPDRGSPEG